MSFRHVALLHAQPRVPLTHAYHIADLIELCGLAACIREHVGEVTIPLTPTDRDPMGQLERFMRERRPDLVGISCFTCSARSALECAEVAARYGAYVVLGGYHPSALPEEMLASPAVGAVVRGEGELTLTELVQRGSPEGIAGMSYRSDGKIVHEPDRPVIADLDVLPLPLRELRPPRFGLAGLEYHTDTVFASRGCRGKCVFCANHLVGKAWRQRSIDHIFSELESIPPPRGRRPKVVKFWDSNFLTQAERIEELCERIIASGMNRYLRFIAETRAEDVVRAEPILGTMQRAGFVRVGCGIESPNRETHRHLNKGLNLAHVERAAELLTSHNMLFSKFLIVGHATESAEDILRYPDYALSHGVKLQNTTFMVMTPYPATELARHHEQEGLIISHDWDLYTNFGAVIEPNGLSAKQLQTLLCSVIASYSISRRFLLGASVAKVIGRLLESLLVHLQVALRHPRFTIRDVELSLWEALAAVQGEREREPAGGPGSGSPGMALVLHCEDRPPLEIGMFRRAGREVLAIRVVEDRTAADQAEPAARAMRRVHLSIGQLVALSRRLDLYRLSHDSMTLTWNRSGFQAAWLPSLLGQLGKLGLGLVGMAAFHARTAVRGPEWVGGTWPAPPGTPGEPAQPA